MEDFVQQTLRGALIEQQDRVDYLTTRIDDLRKELQDLRQERDQAAQRRDALRQAVQDGDV